MYGLQPGHMGLQPALEGCNRRPITCTAPRSGSIACYPFSQAGPSQAVASGAPIPAGGASGAGGAGGAGGADPLSAALHAAQRAAQRAAAEAQRRANTERRAVAAAVAPLAAATPLADGVDLSQEQRGRPEWTT